MSSIHTVLLSVWLHWLFISRELGFNGLHTSVSRKSPDSTQVCSPVSSKGLWRMKSAWWKREWDLSAPSSYSSTQQDELMSTEKWQEGPRQGTPRNVMMLLDVFEMLMSLAGQRQWHRCVFLSRLNVLPASKVWWGLRAETQQEKDRSEGSFCVQGQKSDRQAKRRKAQPVCFNIRQFSFWGDNKNNLWKLLHYLLFHTYIYLLT